MEIDRGVQNIRRENEQEGDFSSKLLHEKERTVALDRGGLNIISEKSSRHRPSFQQHNLIKITTVTPTSSLPPYGDHH
eukprot:scaffold5445_cov140-Skeletonema_marinoi.AAC.3